jgi:hypothetical protein
MNSVRLIGNITVVLIHVKLSKILLKIYNENSLYTVNQNVNYYLKFILKSTEKTCYLELHH